MIFRERRSGGRERERKRKRERERERERERCERDTLSGCLLYMP